eukprot:1190336-Prorocentrum_minimum.AAC.3
MYMVDFSCAVLCSRSARVEGMHKRRVPFSREVFHQCKFLNVYFKRVSFAMRRCDSVLVLPLASPFESSNTIRDMAELRVLDMLKVKPCAAHALRSCDSPVVLHRETLLP